MQSNTNSDSERARLAYRESNSDTSASSFGPGPSASSSRYSSSSRHYYYYNDPSTDSSRHPLRRRGGGRKRGAPPPHLAMPLSMRLMKQVAGICGCVDCDPPTSSSSKWLEDHPDLNVMLNYDMQSLYCRPTADSSNPPPSSVSPMVLAPMTLPVTPELPLTTNHPDSGVDSETEDDEDEKHHHPGTLMNVYAQPTPQQSTTSPEQEEVQQLLGLKSSPPVASIPPAPNATNPSALSSSPALNTTMPSPTFQSSHARVVERILSDYIAACRFYGCGDRVNAGVLTTLRFSLPCLRVVGRFHDADMLALAEILFRYVNGPLRYIKRLDFSLSGKHAPPRWTGHTSRGMHSHGALTLAKVLQMSQYIEQVLLSRNRIGPYGASALFIACSTNPVIRKLYLRRCRVGERGALVFAELVVPSKTTGLQEIDLSANCIGVKGCFAIEQALLERTPAVEKTKDDNHNNAKPLPTMTIDLEGNLVLQEVMNAATHGLGIVLAMIGSYLLTQRAKKYDDYRHTWSCAIYSMSLIVLYTSSTLYHSFFSMQHTKYIFEILDKSAIYILIAGSYTPFLQLILGHEAIWSIGLLAFLWSCCCLGISVEAMCPTWKYRTTFSLAMYLSMGWSALACLPRIAVLVPRSCIQHMVLGGVAYTSGVPFFVRNNNLDHAVWHVFVLAGSIFHWCGVYFYVVDFVLPHEYR